MYEPNNFADEELATITGRFVNIRRWYQEWQSD